MRALLVAAVSCLMMVPALAQEAAAPVPTPKYDVATVKENKSASQMTMVNFNFGDTLKVENATLEIMVMMAFDRHKEQVEGVPKWGQSQHFDVQAKMLDVTPEQIKALTMDQRRAMFATVLQDRFQLKTHWETRDKPEYELVIAKGGSKLKESTGERGGVMLSPQTLKGTWVTPANFADMFAVVVQQPVVDKTGLTGKYDVDLKWTPMNSKEGGDASAPADEDSGPSFFTAVKETLGLELKPTHGQVKVLVVDSAQEPSLEN